MQYQWNIDLMPEERLVDPLHIVSPRGVRGHRIGQPVLAEALLLRIERIVAQQLVQRRLGRNRRAERRRREHGEGRQGDMDDSDDDRFDGVEV